MPTAIISPFDDNHPLNVEGLNARLLALVNIINALAGEEKIQYGIGGDVLSVYMPKTGGDFIGAISAPSILVGNDTQKYAVITLSDVDLDNLRQHLNLQQYLTRTIGDGVYVLQTALTTTLDSYYTKTAADVRYYTKTAADERYLPSSTTLFTKSQADVLYMPIGEVSVPAGTIAYWPGNTAPSGWLLNNGGAISRTTYADLFAVFGTKFGDGDGSTTFNLPDPKGRFLRVYDAGHSIDSASSIGLARNDSFASHSHSINYKLDFGTDTGNPILDAAPHYNQTPGSDISTGNTGSSETSPKSYVIGHTISKY